MKTCCEKKLLNYRDIELMYRDLGFETYETVKENNSETHRMKRQVPNFGTYLVDITILNEQKRGSSSYGKVTVAVRYPPKVSDTVGEFVFNRTPHGLVLIDESK